MFLIPTLIMNMVQTTIVLSASLSQRYHIVGKCNVVRSITRECVTCRRKAVKPQPQMLGQLPIERVTPGPVFDKVGELVLTMLGPCWSSTVMCVSRLS